MSSVSFEDVLRVLQGFQSHPDKVHVILKIVSQIFYRVKEESEIICL